MAQSVDLEQCNWKMANQAAENLNNHPTRLQANKAFGQGICFAFITDLTFWNIW
jgi:hypothetical protein